jgi:ligand-binding SRPBCC domain-containing protein
MACGSRRLPHDGRVPRFVKASRFRASVRDLFGFHERPEALARLTPPWEKSRVIVPPVSLAVGTVVVVESYLGPLRMQLEAEHIGYERDVEFVDRLNKGPFARWTHRHRFLADGEGAILVDDIEYGLPLAPLSRPADWLVVRPRLTKLFDYRHDETARALEVFPPEPLDPARF